MRLYLVYTLPKWIDETFTVKSISMPFNYVLFNQFDLHPPGYYLFLKLWSLINASLIWLRLSSVLLFIVNCLLLYKIGGKTVNKKYSYLLVISYAFSGYSIIFDWSLRPYTGLCTLILGSFYLLTLPQTRKILFAFLILNAFGLYFDYGFIWYFCSLVIFIVYQTCESAKGKKTINLKYFLVPTIGSACFYILVWGFQFISRFHEALAVVNWIRFYTSPSFIIHFFLGTAHGINAFFIVLGLQFIIGSLYLLRKKQNVLFYFFPISSIMTLCFTSVFSVFISPILHVRNLQIVGLSVIIIYALCFYWLSEKKYLYAVVIALGIYVANFFFIVNTIFNTPGRLLLKF